MSNPTWKQSLFAVFVAGALASAPFVIVASQHPSPPPPQPRQSPNAPTNQNVPQGLEGQPQSGPEQSKASLDRQNEREIRLGVERLYVLVTQLKQEVDQTNSDLVFNVAVLKRAQDIEKLAKQIKDRAKR